MRTRINFTLDKVKSLSVLILIYMFIFLTSTKETNNEKLYASNDSCFYVSKREEGTKCNSKSSLRVWFKNRCNVSKRIHFSFKLADGSWEKGSALVRPGEETTYYVCYGDADGTVEWRDSNP